ncbi:hypothetical protein GG344DRAFT_70464 [Lentinula edodes]|nr:hypothetical protein GG344DRAFT_70464 [Lentinula edodes]
MFKHPNLCTSQIDMDELEANPLAAESEDELEDFDKRRSITQNLTDRSSSEEFTSSTVDKWHVNNPSIQKEAEKRRKNAERQRVLRAKRKAEKEAANADSEDHSDHEVNRHRPAKKAHVQAPIEAVEDVKAEMIAYIRIRKDILQPAASGFRGKGRQPANPNPNDETLFSSRGPIFVPLATPYDSFLAMISKSLPCPVIDIVQNSIQYQAQSPQTSPILPAGSHDAFKAMVMHFTTQSRKKNANLSLFIYMDKC